MKKGYIKLYRKITENVFWSLKPFSKAQAWIDLLLLANYKDGKVSFREGIFEVKSGQHITSEIKLSQKWGWSRGKTKTFLNSLKNEHMIEIKQDNRKTLITICNYETYQNNILGDDTTERQQTVQQKDNRKTSERQQTDINKKLKNIKNVKNVNKEPSQTFSYENVFNHYLSKFNLIKHKRLTKEMRNAMDICRKRLEIGEKEMMILIDRHSEIIDGNKNKKDYLVKVRGISQFFGQKISNGSVLICSEYQDDGDKWTSYIDGTAKSYGKDKPKEY